MEVKNRVSVIIPSRTGLFLPQTVNDLLKKSRGDVEIIVVLDGYETPTDFKDDRVTVIAFNEAVGMRACINRGVDSATGNFIMKTDEHCMFAYGWDTDLAKDCKDNWVVIPRRYRLDAVRWQIIEDGRPPVDYMYLSDKGGELHGWKWDTRGEERKNIMIDETPSFQGSCWFMGKSFWDSTVGPMDDKNYGPFAQEAQEIGNKAWLSGGAVMVNKNTWYAHWHRTTGYNFTNEQQKKFNLDVQRGRSFSLDFWTNNRWDKQVKTFQWLMDRFPRTTK